MFDFLGGLLSSGLKFLGADMDRNTSENIAAANQANQMAALQHGIEWKVADAKRAGIHPLFGLGASTGTFTPVSASSNYADALGDMGQNIGRAVSALGNTGEKELIQEAAAVELEGKKLDNDIRRAKLASMIRTDVAATGSPPAAPVTDPSGAESDPVKVEQEKRQQQLRYFGVNFPNDPYTSDAQTVEDVLGEGASDVLHPLMKGPSMLLYKGKLYAGRAAHELQRRLNARRSVPLPYRDVRRSTFRSDWEDFYGNYRTYRGR